MSEPVVWLPRYGTVLPAACDHMSFSISRTFTESGHAAALSVTWHGAITGTPTRAEYVAALLA